MPIEIQYTDDRKGIIFCAVGKVTGKDIIEKQISIYNSAKFIDIKYWIVDRSKCTEYDVNKGDIVQIADIDNDAAKTNPDLLMALVSESNFQFGMSRMYEAHINKEGFKTMVFEKMSEAKNWVNSELAKQL